MRDYYKFYYKIENLSRASGSGIHVLTSDEKIITKKKLLQKILNYKFYYKIENLSRASGGGIHILSSETFLKFGKMLCSDNC